MSFRTFGWFGPSCPVTSVFQPVSFCVHDFNSSIPAPQPIGGRVNFPLDIAMKIFWEASSYTVQSSISATISQQNKNDSQTITIPWGSINDSGGGFFPSRESLTTASEMLCAIQRNVAGLPDYHTLYRSFSSYVTFLVSPRPVIFDGLLAFEMRCIHDISALFPADGVFHRTEFSLAPPSNGRGSWDLITPWGSFNLPLVWSRPQQMNLNSLTITVSAADPNIRYA